MGIFQQFPYTNFHEMNLDQIIKIMREMQDEWASTKAEWSSYKEFIDNYFANLDLDDEVLRAIQAMAASGELNQVIDPVIANETADWLAEHITQPTTPAIDTSLTVAGAAADAYSAGYNINNVSKQSQFYKLSSFVEVRDFLNNNLISGVYDPVTHEINATTTRLTIPFIICSENDFTLAVVNGYDFSRAILNSNSRFDVNSSTGWVDTLTFYRNTYYIVNVRKEDNTTISPTENPFVVADLKRYNNPVDFAIANESNVKAVSHRGYMADAPENTLPAFKLAATRGFRCIESDVAFTSDDVPVMIHDATIDRTSNGTGAVASMTYAQLLTYDFGSWFNVRYTGTKIPTFKQYIHFCKMAQVEAQIEIKTDSVYTQSQLDLLVDIVVEEGMVDNVVWTSYGHGYLNMILNRLPDAKIGYLYGWYNIDDSINMIQTNFPDAFIQMLPTDATSANIAKLKQNKIPLYVAVLDTIGEIVTADPYISGILSNKFVASTEMYFNTLLN